MHGPEIVDPKEFVYNNPFRVLTHYTLNTIVPNYAIYTVPKTTSSSQELMYTYKSNCSNKRIIYEPEVLFKLI